MLITHILNNTVTMETTTYLERTKGVAFSIDQLTLITEFVKRTSFPSLKSFYFSVVFLHLWFVSETVAFSITAKNINNS